MVGSGLSGIGAVQALHHAGAAPLLLLTACHFEICHLHHNRQYLDYIDKTYDRDKERHLLAEVVIGTLPEEQNESVELVVLSPGVPTDTAFVDSADRLLRRRIVFHGVMAVQVIRRNV